MNPYKKFHIIPLALIAFAFCIITLLPGCDDKLPSLSPTIIGVPVYPGAINLHGWTKETRPHSNLGIGLVDNTPYPDYYFGYEVPGVKGDLITRFYSNSLSKAGWVKKGKTEKTWDAEYQIRSWLMDFTKDNSLRLNFGTHTYYAKESFISKLLNGPSPTSVRITVYKIKKPQIKRGK